ncbi:hypothetical protein DPEC_G00036440 [Dallia pectoralis]|uniref:Uncharacterized protein n=1 Tax=Dallia pectoralis TaxID=75939 RepID=A0ACC2HDT4_DALPE|nr:hypothetical protein DPEC_G00036440 [Dallia pectoralis]
MCQAINAFRLVVAACMQSLLVLIDDCRLWATLAMFAKEAETTEGPKTILPGSSVNGTVLWEVEKVLRAALRYDPGPVYGPPGRQFVPNPTQPMVLQWGHISKLRGRSYHGVPEEMILVAVFEEDIKPMSMPAQSALRTRAPTGQSPTGRPCSHLTLDFVTGLPLYKDHRPQCTHLEKVPGNHGKHLHSSSRHSLSSPVTTAHFIS